MERVVVIDYGMGNLRSVAKALEHAGGAGAQIEISSDPHRIGEADRVVFPGQGAIRDCMAELDRLGLRNVILECARTRPFLGICLGLQALMERSDEDRSASGLGLFAGGVARFPADATDPVSGMRLKVPHMGWNQVYPARDHPLWEGIASGTRFYFVHSYYVTPRAADIVAARCSYGVDFVCAIAHRNLFAVQFHPEKSQRAGLTLLGNFLAWLPD